MIQRCYEQEEKLLSFKRYELNVSKVFSQDIPRWKKIERKRIEDEIRKDNEVFLDAEGDDEWNLN